jgi:tetratricopeptide (TPR) repeat protein
MSRKSSIGRLALLSSASILFGQAPTNPSPAPAPTNNNRTTNPSPTNNPTPRPTPIPEQPRPIFLSGRVVLEDGSAPADRAKIERVCFTTTVVEGYTDSKGNFNIQLGQRFGVFQDASVSGLADIGGSLAGTPGGDNSRSALSGGNSGGISERDLANCEIRAVLNGYAGASISLAGHHALDNPEIGTIILHSLAGVTGFTYSATSGLAPKDARKSFEKGTERYGQRKLPEAQKELEKAVTIYPKFAAAWATLGEVYLAEQDTDKAIEAFHKSIEADERFVNPYVGMFPIYAQKSDWPELNKLSTRVIQLNAVQFPQAYYLNAVANFNLKDYKVAENSAREAIRLDTGHRYPRSEYVLALVLALRNENAESAQYLRSFVARTQGAEQESAKQQLAEVERRLSSPRPQ